VFNADSWLESLNIYVVENIVHSVVALGIVWLVLALFRIRDPISRMRLLLLPLVLPIFTPIAFYWLFPERQGMWVLPLDKVLSIRSVFDDPARWEAFSRVAGLGLAVVAVFLLLKVAITVIAVTSLPRRFHAVQKGENSHLDALLSAATRGSSPARPQVLLSPSTSVESFSFGLRKPYLVISLGLLRRLGDSDIRAALAHELGHIRRHDGWLAFLLVSLRHILIFNPVVHLLGHRLRLESEMAADDAALGIGISRLAYAQALLTVSRLSLARQPSYLGSNTFSSGTRALRQRVHHILEPSPSSQRTLHKWLPVMASALLLGVLFFLC